MRRKKELLAGLGRYLDLPTEAIPGGFGLSLSGREQLTVRGCREILIYTPAEIRLSLGRVALSVGGEGLLCTVLEAGNVTVEGLVCTLSFEPLKKGEEGYRET